MQFDNTSNVCYILQYRFSHMPNILYVYLMFFVSNNNNNNKIFTEKLKSFRKNRVQKFNKIFDDLPSIGVSVINTSK